MKSFLSTLSRDFEQYILSLIGDYAGFTDVKLRFSVTKRRHLGKIMIVNAAGKTRKLDHNSWGTVYDLDIYNAYQTMLENICKAQRCLRLLCQTDFSIELHKLVSSLDSQMVGKYTLDYSLTFPRNGYRGYFRATTQ